MLRFGNTRSDHWADKTMSVLRANQLEACGKYLAGLPCRCLFDADCTDADAENLYDLSYYAVEEKRTTLHTIQELRSRVLTAFPAEFALLSEEEHDLAIRAALSGGTYLLSSWGETDPARCLVRRLWCKVEHREEQITLILPRELCMPMLLLAATDDHRQLRETVNQVLDSVDDSLYLTGAIQANGPMLHLKSLLKDTFVSAWPHLICRLLRTSFDYLYDRSGEALLIHSGLADPDRLLCSPVASFHLSLLSGEDLTQALNSLESIENPLYDRMLGLLMGAVRPEITPEDAVEDLIILAKQDVPFNDMKEVLSSMLITGFTEEMLQALKDLSTLVPRWLCLNTSRVQ